MGIGEDYEHYDGLGLAELVARGEVTALELLESALERLEKHRELGAVPIQMIDEARRTIANGVPDGPFAGVPFLLKDLHVLYEGAPTTFGSSLFVDFVADHDSELVTRYKGAGFVAFGKSASPEFGITATTESRLYGPTRNPWKTSHSSGGSSGGAAAAVAAGILPVANASDGGGSIRIPASCCGLFGLKPTRARTPMGPDAGEGWAGMSTQHVVSRSVRDSAAALDATHGPAPGDPYAAPPPPRPYLEEVGRDPGKLRIALQTDTFNGAPTHEDCRAAAEHAAQLCRELGHEVTEARFEVDAQEFGEATGAVISSNLRSTVMDRAAQLGRALEPDDIEPMTYAMVMNAENVSGETYARSVRTIHRVGREFAAFARDFDIWLTPTMATPPLPLGVIGLDMKDPAATIAGLDRSIGFTQLFNATGSPAASVPLYWNADGLPVGAQLVGRFGEDGALLCLAAQLEQAQPWFDRRPGDRP